jgi:hypothetical protein
MTIFFTLATRSGKRFASEQDHVKKQLGRNPDLWIAAQSLTALVQIVFNWPESVLLLKAYSLFVRSR